MDKGERRFGYETADCATYNLLRNFARANRQNPTEAEAIMWHFLRRKGLGLRFRRQHSVEGYIPDFVCLSLRLIIEIDGGYHFKETMPEDDKARTAHLERHGYTILRFTNNEVIGNTSQVIDKIKATMSQLQQNNGALAAQQTSGASANGSTKARPEAADPSQTRPVTPSFGGGGGRLLIFSAPSGSGKSTIVSYLMREHPELNLAFSVSATTRPPRGTERNGVEYIFLTEDEFRRKIDAGEFLEHEEVYPGRFYGTLKSQVDHQTARGENVVFDVDVKGGCNIKQHYGDRALSIFIQPPSIEELRRRLVGRATDAPEVIEQRLQKASYELTFAPRFDHIVVNDNLEEAEAETLRLVKAFLGGDAAEQDA